MFGLFDVGQLCVASSCDSFQGTHLVMPELVAKRREDAQRRDVCRFVDHVRKLALEVGEECASCIVIAWSLNRKQQDENSRDGVSTKRVNKEEEEEEEEEDKQVEEASTR